MSDRTITRSPQELAEEELRQLRGAVDLLIAQIRGNQTARVVDLATRMGKRLTWRDATVSEALAATAILAAHAALAADKAGINPLIASMALGRVIMDAVQQSIVVPNDAPAADDDKD